MKYMRQRDLYETLSCQMFCVFLLNHEIANLAKPIARILHVSRCHAGNGDGNKLRHAVAEEDGPRNGVHVEDREEDDGEVKQVHLQ